MPEISLIAEIRAALGKFLDQPLTDAARGFFRTLGYESSRTALLPEEPAAFFAALGSAPDPSTLDGLQRCALLFQLTNDEIPRLLQKTGSLFEGAANWATDIIESFVFLALEFKEGEYGRHTLALVTRQLNRMFPMPAVVLFKYGEKISLSVIDRRRNKRDPLRDVVEGRISVVKDVHCRDPHRGHVEVLNDFAFPILTQRVQPSSFRQLYDAWLSVLSIQTLNERFYREIADWYFWALREVRFPKGQPSDANGQMSVAVIRLLTRMIFVWFLREEQLVPDELFDPTSLGTLLARAPGRHPKESNYYRAVLQNLFFATLNTPMDGIGGRGWITRGSGGQSGHYLVHTKRRYKDEFSQPDVAGGLFSKVPFLNGGLFECLDRKITEEDLERSPNLKTLATKEGEALVLRVDGFSERPGNAPHVPNKLFFSQGEEVDLNEEYGTRGRPHQVYGLIHILSRYKFTIEENTPADEEVALDPELLGKVFENLLASYNEDTSTTARKLSGSFYTPREVVEFMVDEVLAAYLEVALASAGTSEEEDASDRLRHLLSYHQEGHDFTPEETDTLIAAIERMRVLDPACGSGAYPMGMLQKLVLVLRKLDPENVRWKAQNRRPLERELGEARRIEDPTLYEKRVGEVEDALARFDQDFAEVGYTDYSRKLYLIEKCLYGVDIQPIAVQIAKLRFFIALLVSQRVDPRRPNSNITPLPNLETKIVAANTLRSIDRGPGLRSVRVVDAEQALRQATLGHFAARTSRTKEKRRKEIQKGRKRLLSLLREDSLLDDQVTAQLAHWDPFDQSMSADFFDPEWMFQLTEGFDIVIGNPPYVRQEQIKDQKPYLKQHYDCFTGTADLYVYFYERGVKLLKSHGVFAFISSNKWFRAKYGEKLRDWMSRNTRIRQIIDFGDEAVFKAIAYPTIVIAIKRERATGHALAGETVRALNWEKNQPTERLPEIALTDSFPISQQDLPMAGWQLERPFKRKLLERLRGIGMPLGEYCGGRLYRGVLTGLNEAFVIDGATRAQLIADDPRSAEVIKPFLRGRDVKRWRAVPADLWLIFTRHGIDIRRYPAIRRHLQAYRNSLEPRPRDWDESANGPWRGRKAGSYKWFEIQDNVAYWREFEGNKIIAPAIDSGASYYIDRHGYFSNDKTSIIVCDDLVYLTGILNSSISWWITQQTFASRQGGFYEFKPMYLSQLPIPASSEEQRSIIESVVSMIVAAPGCSARFEQLLNALVYELFIPDELARADLHFFEALKETLPVGIDAFSEDQCRDAADELASIIFDRGHRLYNMLFTLQGLDSVRLIEGKE